MRVPMSWLTEHVRLAESVGVADVGHALIRLGLEVTGVESAGSELAGPIVVGRVLSAEPETHSNNKTVSWCLVDVGQHNPEGERGRGIICGADNVTEGALVVAALPGAELPGGFTISSRKTYGHISDGMLCAADELGLGEDHDGIIILAEEAGVPLVPGEDALEALHVRDDVLEIDLTPDLGYCMSIRGVAREISQAFEAPFSDPVTLAVPEARDKGQAVRLETENCPLMCAVTVNDVDVTVPTPRHIVRRLVLAGMRPVSLPVDIANYVMLETGQPLHTYDAGQVVGALVVRMAVDGEELETLDGVQRSLTADDIVIADDTGAIGLAGLMGGASTEVSDRTRTVLIEAAHFNRRRIQASLNRHQLSSEASRRFARGVDPAATYAAARRVAELLAKYGSGKRNTDDSVVGSVPEPGTVRMDADLPTRVVGFEIPRERVLSVLESSRVSTTALGGVLSMVPPSWRFDLQDPQDFVEEVVRKVGLDQLEGTLPSAPAGRGLSAGQRARRRLADALCVAGLVEVRPLPFMGADDLEALALAPEDPRAAVVTLANPMTSDLPHLRSTLLPGLAATLRRNKARGIDDVAVFDIGRAFRRGASGTAPRPGVDERPPAEVLDAIDAVLPQQEMHVGVLLAGEWRPRDGRGMQEPAGWTHAISLALLVGEVHGVALERRQVECAPWHPGRCAALAVGDAIVGHAGELHPSACEKWGLPARSCAVEINVDHLLSLAEPLREVTSLSHHPVLKEDVALIVDERVSASAVQSALAEGAGPLLETLRLFDVFTGPQAGEGKKSLAFAMEFRSPDRTLTQHEATLAKELAVAAAAEAWDAVQRVD